MSLEETETAERQLAQEATATVPAVAVDATAAAAESIITESEAEPIYIDGTNAAEENMDDADSDVELTDEEDVPHVGLPLPIEHIYVQDPRQPLLLSDFQVLKTLGALSPLCF